MAPRTPATVRDAEQSDDENGLRGPRTVTETRRLRAELRRAKVIPSQEAPAGLVTMNSRILYVDVALRLATEVTLVYPWRAGERSALSVFSPVVTGVVLQHLLDDREGAARTIRRALDLAADYEHTPLASRSPLEEVHVEANGEMTLVVGKNAVALHMGAPPYRRKLEQAIRVIAELDCRGAKPDSIMLDNEARPDRVVVRMR